MSASADKVKAVQEYPVSKSAKVVRAHFGLATFYPTLITNFPEVAKAVTSLTGKNQTFLWLPSQQEALEWMKDGLCTPPSVRLPQF